ncbi:MAG: hypothetical protein Q9180_006702 [Flavoplaca navasiana]
MPAKVPTRQLGKNGPRVTALGFGAMGLSAFYGAPESDETRFKVLDRAYELGETFWDSADVYMDSAVRSSSVSGSNALAKGTTSSSPPNSPT